MIRLERIKKSFGNLNAVDDISLNIEKGELFSFLGPNGAGKTTTIKMIVGLMSPDAGKIFIKGNDISQFPEDSKQIIGYVPDNAFLYGKLTGMEYFQVIGNFFKMSVSEIEERVTYYQGILGFKDWLHDRIEGYSQGMRQRITFAAAFMHEPEILIIDEPMVGLDPRSARTIKQMLKEKSKSGTTIFLSTHNLSVAEELSDRIGIVQKGRLLTEGTMEALGKQVASAENLEDLFLELVGADE
ncbi:MAG: ABC transporter ATP-binding protein [Fidelibacterota bacterium]